MSVLPPVRLADAQALKRGRKKRPRIECAFITSRFGGARSSAPAAVHRSVPFPILQPPAARIQAFHGPQTARRTLSAPTPGAESALAIPHWGRYNLPAQLSSFPTRDGVAVALNGIEIDTAGPRALAEPVAPLRESGLALRPGLPMEYLFERLEAWTRRWQARPLRCLLLPIVLLAVQIGPWWLPTPDASAYMSIARNLAHGHGLRNLGSRHLGYPPGYPALLSPVFLAGERPLLLLAVQQWLLAVGLTVGIYVWVRRIVPEAAAALAALAMINSGLWIHYRRTLTEVAFTCTLVWTANALGAAMRGSAAPGGRLDCPGGPAGGNDVPDPTGRRDPGGRPGRDAVALCAARPGLVAPRRRAGRRHSAASRRGRGRLPRLGMPHRAGDRRHHVSQRVCRLGPVLWQRLPARSAGMHQRDRPRAVAGDVQVVRAAGLLVGLEHARVPSAIRGAGADGGAGRGGSPTRWGGCCPVTFCRFWWLGTTTRGAVLRAHDSGAVGLRLVWRRAGEAAPGVGGGDLGRATW